MHEQGDMETCASACVDGERRRQRLPTVVVEVHFDGYETRREIRGRLVQLMAVIVKSLHSLLHAATHSPRVRAGRITASCIGSRRMSSEREDSLETTSAAVLLRQEKGVVGIEPGSQWSLVSHTIRLGKRRTGKRLSEKTE